MNPRSKLVIILLSIMAAMLAASSVSAGQPVIHAMLFFSPSCPHCHEVMEKTLPPLVEKYNGQLDIIGIDVSKPLGQDLYRATVVKYNIPESRYGIPTLVVGDNVLVSAYEINQELPGIIEKGLASGGIGWPDIPGLQQVLAAQPSTLDQKSEGNASLSNNPAFVNKFSNDLLANHIAVLVLLGMIASVIGVGYNFVKGTETRFARWPNWVVPLLAIAGMGVALYLSYVEISESEAICGPVGNCNSVQQSPYARLFGIIPIGIIGLVGYLAILVAWVLGGKGPQSWRNYSTLAIWGMGWFGVLFSIYLTFLEPFVIGSTCAWCITSAIIMTLILLTSTDSARQALIIPESSVLEEEGDNAEGDEQEEIDLNQDA